MKIYPRPEIWISAATSSLTVPERRRQSYRAEAVIGYLNNSPWARQPSKSMTSPSPEERRSGTEVETRPTPPRDRSPFELVRSATTPPQPSEGGSPPEMVPPC